MSIFASLASPTDDDHADDCAQWDKHGDTWDISDRPCDCGQPDAPIIYQGSHVMPAENDTRGGYVDLALIPAHVRYWRDNPDAVTDTEPTEGHEPYLRFGVNESTVILTRRHVEQIHDQL